MGLTRTCFDVAVVGGGPVGSVAAVAFARRGASVIVLEADPRAARRFAGEWIHPTGVSVLDALRMGRLETAAPRTGYGFVILPDDRTEPVEMPYPEGVALSCGHEAMVASLRETAKSVPGVTFVPFARAVSIEGHRITVDEREHGRRVEITAGRIVGADGRTSLVRRALGLAENSTLLSYMASCELNDVELPFEGFGHVVLGGPGPALLYRIGPDTVRACLDVPLHHGPGGRSPEFLWEAFSPVLPQKVIRAFRRSIEKGPVLWAATRFRPRADFGTNTVSLVGDALGHVHPMTAIGLTMGFLDAQSLARLDSIGEYGRERRGHIPELLSNALYHCFRRDDPSATKVRQTMFQVLRADAAERKRTMQILAGREAGTGSFGSAFLRIAAGAIGSTAVEAARRGGLRAIPGALAAYGEWMQWPAASVLPRALGDRFRGKSTTTHPLPFLSGILPVNEALPLSEAGLHREVPVVNTGSAEFPEKVGKAPTEVQRARRAVRTAPPTAKAISKATDHLIRELENLALKLGHIPDEVLGTPAMRMMRAITATDMRTGVAARMMIGRRRLTTEGFPRLLGVSGKVGWKSPGGNRPAYATSLVAELLLVLLDGSTWVKSPVTGLGDGVNALLERQTESGGFAVFAAATPPKRGGDLHATALACQALGLLLKRLPGVFDARANPALSRAAAWLHQQQAKDGSFGSDEETDRITSTAYAMEGLSAAEQNPTDPALRRATRWLLLSQQPSGAFTSHLTDVIDAHVRRRTARALRALLVVRAPHRDAILAAAGLIATALAEGRHEEPCAGSASWEECWESLLALALFAAREKATTFTDLVAPHPAPLSLPTALTVGEAGADWAFCRERLAEVSRSFSRPIALLPSHLEMAVTLGYLLCRTADTVEDHPAVQSAKRQPLFATLLEVLHGKRAPTEFVDQLADVPGDDPEMVLGRNLPVVMRVFASQPESTRLTLAKWVSEMIRGMALYTHREPGIDGVTALLTEADLERYCYFVAGTVGHLLTDLFLEEIGDDADPALSLTLRTHAEGFAMGLQLVNVLKDVTDDSARRWSYIPRTACTAAGVGVSELSNPHFRAAAHAAVLPLFDIAQKKLDDGLNYALAIPPEHTGVRLFCLLPLWMAARTLVLAKGNDAMFTPREPVKISREEVEAITASVLSHCSDNGTLRASYADLWRDPAGLQRSAS